MAEWWVEVERERVVQRQVVDGVEGEILACLGNVVVALTPADFSIASSASPWRERERKKERVVSSVFCVAFGLVG